MDTASSQSNGNSPPQTESPEQSADQLRRLAAKHLREVVRYANAGNHAAAKFHSKLAMEYDAQARAAAQANE